MEEDPRSRRSTNVVRGHSWTKLKTRETRLTKSCFCVQSPHTDDNYDKHKEADESNQVPLGQIYDTFHMHPRN